MCPIEFTMHYPVTVQVDIDEKNWLVGVKLKGRFWRNFFKLKLGNVTSIENCPDTSILKNIEEGELS